MTNFSAVFKAFQLICIFIKQKLLGNRLNNVNMIDSDSWV